MINKFKIERCLVKIRNNLHPAAIFLLFGFIFLNAACSGDVSIVSTEVVVTEIYDEVTLDDLIGVWGALETVSYYQFNFDGTYLIALNLEGLMNSPVEAGQYTFDGRLFTYTSSIESIYCFAGLHGIYTLERIGETVIRQVLLEDECDIRRHSRVTLQRIP